MLVRWAQGCVKMQAHNSSDGNRAPDTSPAERDDVMSKTAKKAAKGAAKPKKESMASVAYEMIKAGKTNAEVRTVLEKKFSLPEEHAYYPSWYRSKLVQTNQITKKFAEDHSGEPAREAKPKAEKKGKVKVTKSAPKKSAKAAGLATATQG